MHKFKFKGFAETKEDFEKIIRYNMDANKIDKGKTYVFIDKDNKSIDCDLDSLDFYWNYPIAIYVVKNKKPKEEGVPLINVWGTNEKVKEYLTKGEVDVK